MQLTPFHSLAQPSCSGIVMRSHRDSVCCPDNPHQPRTQVAGTLRPEDSAAQLAEHGPEKQQAKAHPPTLIHQKLKPSAQVQSEDTFLSTYVSVRSFQKPYPNNRRTWLCPEELSAPGKSEEREIHSLVETGKLQKPRTRPPLAQPSQRTHLAETGR